MSSPLAARIAFRRRTLTLSALTVFIVVAHLAAAATIFRAPGADGWSVWNADKAERDGKWDVGGPSGVGERYLQPSTADAGSLLFPFEVDRPTTLRVRPMWWPTGEQKLARRFPYPLVRQPGPDAVDCFGTTLFTTAPAAGRVIAVDAATGKFIGFTDVGGYLADLVVDRDSGRIYVADALGDRVVVVDAGTRAIVATLNAPGGPWSLALHQGILYVACRENSRLLAFDAASGMMTRQVELPASPIGLELVGGPPAKLVVRFQQRTFDVLTLAETPADEQQYTRSEDSENPPFYQFELGPRAVTLITKDGRRTLDVASVVDGRPGDAIVGRFGDDRGPASPVSVAISDESTKAKLAFFTSPSLGRIGVIDGESGAVDAIEVGGYLADLIMDEGKLIWEPDAAKRDNGKLLYIADAANNRVLILEPKTRVIQCQINVPGRPWRLAVVTEVATQRVGWEGLPWSPTQVNRLYITCLDTNDLAVVDLTTRQIVKRVPLGAQPRGVKMAPMPSPIGGPSWPSWADDRIAFGLQPRIAVETMPMELNLTTDQRSPDSLAVPEVAPRRDSVSVFLPGEKTPVRVSAGDQLVLSIGEKRKLDLSSVADPQMLPQQPLAPKDAPGSLTIALDDGPEYDWVAGVWQAPDSEMFLVNESEEFWRYNAPALQVAPGRHVLRVEAHSQFARLEAVAACRSPEPAMEMALLPEPREVHGGVPLISYQGVFYDAEPATFTLRASNRSPRAITLSVSYSLRNYMDEPVPVPKREIIRLVPGQTIASPIVLALRDTGRFTLTATADTPDGQIVREVRFLRLPKLEHPRLLLRQDDIPAIKARMARYPNLFRRYAEWIERMSQKEGRFPERFLPPGLTADECAAAAPADAKAESGQPPQCSWRMYELAWRMLAAQFVANYLTPDSASLKAKVDGLLASNRLDRYCQFHYHGPFFPGAEAAFVDSAPDQTRASLKLYQQMASRMGEVDTLPWTLATLEEPLIPEKRALIYEIMTLENNAERYFETHRGRRAGTWWQNPYTECHCPMNAYTLTFMYLHNMFGEPRLFEKPVFGGYLTFQRYAEPLQDRQGLQPNRRGPNGEPWRWILSAITRHPLEKSNYQWDEWVKKMDGPLPGDEQSAVDKLMSLEGISLKGPLAGGINYFVSAVPVPVALALGWYEPSTPPVTQQELPPTAVFDGEGWVAMRSGWDAKATEVSFVSGVRDHTARHKPNHFTVIKAGNYLIGTPALFADDGNPVAVWGNSVVIDDKWPRDWAINLQHVRDGEHLVIHRFSPSSFTYVARDQQVVGYQPAESGFGGGLDLHGHCETMFMREGRLLGYQTWPELDYVAGDAANAWRADQVSRLDRQMVFMKPDLLLVYDRVKLGPGGHRSTWIAATGPHLALDGDRFAIQNGSEFLMGQALLPETPLLTAPKPMELGWIWKAQKLLEIAPMQQKDETEYLVVMRIGGGSAPLPPMDVIHDERSAGVKFSVSGRQIEVRLNRVGPVGGEATVLADGRTDHYQFRQAIVDSYANWRTDPRYDRWMTESRFRFMAPE